MSMKWKLDLNFTRLNIHKVISYYFILIYSKKYNWLFVHLFTLKSFLKLNGWIIITKLKFSTKSN